MVLETGTDVSTVKEGDRVIGLPGFSGMAEECITDHKNLWQIPEKVSSEKLLLCPCRMALLFSPWSIGPVPSLEKLF